MEAQATDTDMQIFKFRILSTESKLQKGLQHNHFCSYIQLRARLEFIAKLTIRKF